MHHYTVCLIYRQQIESIQFLILNLCNATDKTYNILATHDVVTAIIIIQHSLTYYYR